MESYADSLACLLLSAGFLISVDPVSAGAPVLNIFSHSMWNKEYSEIRILGVKISYFAVKFPMEDPRSDHLWGFDRFPSRYGKR